MNIAYPGKNREILTDEGILYLTPEDKEYLQDLIDTTLIEILPEVLLEGEFIPKTKKTLEQLKAVASIELLSQLEMVNPDLRKKLIDLPVEKRKEIVWQIIRSERGGIKGLFFVYYDNEKTPQTGIYEFYEYLPVITMKDIETIEKIINKI